MRRLLITGITGGQGRLLAKRLGETYEIIGIDSKPAGSCPENVRYHSIDLRSRHVEDLFRRVRPDAVVHLGLVRHRFDATLRHDVNVVGTKRLLECCANDTKGERQEIIGIVITCQHLFRLFTGLPLRRIGLLEIIC